LEQRFSTIKALQEGAFDLFNGICLIGATSVQNHYTCARILRTFAAYKVFLSLMGDSKLRF